MGYSHGVAKGRTRLTHTHTHRTRPLLPCLVGRFESPGSETIRPTCTICAPDPESPQGSLSGGGGGAVGADSLWLTAPPPQQPSRCKLNLGSLLFFF